MLTKLKDFVNNVKTRAKDKFVLAKIKFRHMKEAIVCYLQKNGRITRPSFFFVFYSILFVFFLYLLGSEIGTSKAILIVSFLFWFLLISAVLLLKYTEKNQTEKTGDLTSTPPPPDKGAKSDTAKDVAKKPDTAKGKTADKTMGERVLDAIVWIALIIGVVFIVYSIINAVPATIQSYNTARMSAVAQSHKGTLTFWGHSTNGEKCLPIVDTFSEKRWDSESIILVSEGFRPVTFVFDKKTNSGTWTQGGGYHGTWFIASSPSSVGVYEGWTKDHRYPQFQDRLEIKR